VISALFGAALAGLLGWMKGIDPWDTRRFFQSILSGVGAAIAYALAYKFTENQLTALDILAAIGFGAGIDNLVNRGIGAARNSSKK
jgi:hypothetical protein